MSAIAEHAGLGRESLYKAFASGAKPRYDTVLKVLRSPWREAHRVVSLTTQLTQLPCIVGWRRMWLGCVKRAYALDHFESQGVREWTRL